MNQSLFSSVYSRQVTPHCLRLERQVALRGRSLARESVGNSSPANIAMMPITTSSSTRGNAPVRSFMIVETFSGSVRSKLIVEVAEAAGRRLDALDFRVQPLRQGVGNVMAQIRQQVFQ